MNSGISQESIVPSDTKDDLDLKSAERKDPLHIPHTRGRLWNGLYILVLAGLGACLCLGFQSLVDVAIRKSKNPSECLLVEHHVSLDYGIVASWTYEDGAWAKRLKPVAMHSLELDRFGVVDRPEIE
ncbi:hypothetical protein BCR34DRAFT_592477 [Clohesyomyces aquaticus]|uniref:Uncharacterized protein n=1 Tax=Clohesyomyces aquaticus TaxID=1231657 RepID=A0A1Y1YRU5_9PLEO|nr:hypothetical protein BCR34DRAFT_592477 [Clohesyomyces aquaticus]